MARAGDSVRAESLAQQVDKELPSDTLLHDVWLPCIRAAVALDSVKPALAIDLLKPSIADEQVENVFVNVAPIYPPYLPGQALLSLRQGNESAAEFQKIIELISRSSDSIAGSTASGPSD